VGQDRFRPGPGDRPTVDLLELLATSDAELMERYGRWYIPRREPRYLRRNALVALANTADGRDAGVEAALVRALADADPIVRGHAVWAAARLGRHDLLAAVAGDEHPDVRRELEIAASDLT
jgi:epoxyqueuosine reductase